jgi:uncharacterized protein
VSRRRATAAAERVWDAICAAIRTSSTVATSGTIAFLFAGCNPDASNGELPPHQVPAETRPLAITFDTATAFVRTDEDTHALRVEIADREAQRAYGLMDRDVLDSDAGMIFLYETQQPGEAGFWMYRTRIPLDIAFFDGAGRITAILQMEPCPVEDQARCQAMAAAYAPGTPYYGALEVNRGWFRERGVAVGHHVTLPGRLGG